MRCCPFKLRFKREITCTWLYLSDWSHRFRSRNQCIVMADFKCILHLIVLNGVILPGLSLPSSPSATSVESLPSTQQHHATSQFPIQLEGEIIVFVFGQHSGKTEAGTLELDKVTEEDHPGDGYNVLNIEQVSPDDGERRGIEFEKVKRNSWLYEKLRTGNKGKWTESAEKDFCRKV